MPEGPPLSHDDSIRPIPTHGESVYTTRTKYEYHPEKDGYGSVTTRFDGEIELIHPAPDIDTLFRTTHLIAQLHHYNRDQWVCDCQFTNDGTTLYDLAILDVMDDVLEVEGITSTSLDIPLPRFKIVFLKEARQPATLKDFRNYVEGSPPILSELGYDDASDLPSYEIIREESKNRLPDELADLERGQEAFNAAIVRAIYAVFRNGIKMPGSVSDKYGFDAVTPPL